MRKVASRRSHGQLGLEILKCPSMLLPVVKQRPRPSTQQASDRMRRTRRRDTGPELRLRSILHRRGLRFRVDQVVLEGSKARADLVFRRARVAVFVDGCFWHACPVHATWPRANAAWWRSKIQGNVARDRRTDAFLRTAGWSVVRVWEHEDPAEAAQRIERAVVRPLGTVIGGGG